MHEQLRQTILKEGDPVRILRHVVKWLRPAQPHSPSIVADRVHILSTFLDTDPPLRQKLQDSILTLLKSGKQVNLYAETGILPNTGFFSELFRRIGFLLLPEAEDFSRLSHMLHRILDRNRDLVWIVEIPFGCWTELVKSLRFDEIPGGGGPNPTINALLEASRILSYRIAALGLEPEILNLDPSLEDHTSPFLEQNGFITTYLNDYFPGLDNPESPGREVAHVLNALNECRNIVKRIREKAAKDGTSFSLTFHLSRLSQMIKRLRILLCLLSGYRQSRRVDAIAGDIASLITELAHARNRQDVRGHLAQNVGLMALRVTDNAGKIGEHYITATRSEYFSLFRAALGGGGIIALFALLKVLLADPDIPALNEGILFSLNYGICFILIHYLHFTVATKQPAMTAAAIAASIHEMTDTTSDLSGLFLLTARTIRSQLAAIAGNVLLAMATAAVLGILILGVMEKPFPSPEKAEYLLNHLNPVTTLSVFYASIAGVCLFLSGLVTGYFDNATVYHKIPQRIIQIAWARKLFGSGRMTKFAGYVENNLGALAGNFFFGCMLGGVSTLGVLTGLPLDIRHVAFASAHLVYAIISIGQSVPLLSVLAGVAGVAAIGIANLLVSFCLALYVALRARDVSFRQEREFFSQLVRFFRSHPREFFLPPR